MLSGCCSLPVRVLYVAGFVAVGEGEPWQEILLQARTSNMPITKRHFSDRCASMMGVVECMFVQRGGVQNTLGRHGDADRFRSVEDLSGL